MTPKLRLVPALLLLAAASCSGSGGGIQPWRTKVGTAGGSLVIGNGEFTLDVPPGALRDDATISVTQGEDIALPGWLQVCPPYLLQPADLTFLTHATLTLPFDFGLASAMVMDTEIRVAWRDSSGVVSMLNPSYADLGGLVTLDVEELGTFCVVAPDVVSAGELLPQHDTDTFTYDDGLVLTVTRPTTEPHFAPSQIVKWTFTLDGQTWGRYFDTQSGNWNLRGAFGGADWQEVTDQGVQLLTMRDVRGTLRPGTATFTGYVPFGLDNVGYTGLSQVTAEVAEKTRVVTPVGRFDTDRIVVTEVYSNSWPEQGERRLELWCARNVGPVAVRLDDAPSWALLTAGTVNGNEVHGR